MYLRFLRNKKTSIYDNLLINFCPITLRVTIYLLLQTTLLAAYTLKPDQTSVFSKVLYRPPSIRKPPTWQSPPSSESLGVPSGNFDRRPPLRQRMPGNQSIMEQAEPAVDLKYLQRQPQQQGLSRAHHADSAENNENNVEMNARNGKTVKPLLVSTKTRKTEEMKTNGLHIS